MKDYELFGKDTQAFVYGAQINAVQRMLDFDYVCRRKKPSVAAVINPARDGYAKVFFGKDEILLPMYKTLKEAVERHPNAEVMINFSSLRSAYRTTLDAFNFNSIKTVAIIAEGVPERQSRELIEIARQKGKVIIGPATVGSLTAGAFKIGNTGGTIENIIESKLHRKGCVGLVSKSGGMLNEIFNIVSKHTNGVYEGVAIGGDMYPGSTLYEHVMRYERNPDVKIIVVLGEVGGNEEYQIADAIKKGKIKKPVVGWVIGTCAKVFQSEVQFGHAGAKAASREETADSKNLALIKAGAVVPGSFDDFGEKIGKVYKELKRRGKVKDIEDAHAQEVLVEMEKAVSKGFRKETSFVSTISDDRGEEVEYCGIPISRIVEENYGLGDVISLLWFKKKLPAYATKFIEMALIITAEHGPAVSGAHNAIVSARAGKDVVSSLCSGILTIGPRFGGAINDAAKEFKYGYDNKLSPKEFVEYMKNKGEYIPGIGHRIKSVQNPDNRVQLLIKYARKHFPRTGYLDYALEVEKITTSKRNNLILNVDGCIAVLFLDLLGGCKKFSKEEVAEIVELGFLNAIFVLGRSIGIIGHIFDQKRLKQGLYRHPWEDILYLKEK